MNRYLVFLVPMILVIVLFLVLPSRRSHHVQGIDRHGVVSYKNTNETDSNHMGGVYTGLKWQCVEYARRWLISQRGILFESVPDASDIWSLETATRVSGEQVPFHSATTGIPHIGSLLIWGKTETLPHGHVAVVVNVTENEIQLAEQNWTDDVWRSDYARSIPIQNGTIHEPGIVGWKYV